MKTLVLQRCQAALPGWRGLGIDDFDFDDPKGFSSFTMGVRCRRADATPAAALYRHLDGKDNALLDFDDERRVYLALADAGVAAACHAYARTHRIEAFYDGRTLTRHDLADPTILRQIGGQLRRLHAVAPAALPPEPFFDRLFARWSPLARATLVDARAGFPEHEQALCEALMPILSPDTLDRVRSLMPDEPLGFCHNDTYHGNTFLLSSGEVRLLDFEFSCLGHRAFDFANLFAETVMRHKLPDYPHFDVVAPEYDEADIGALIDGYLDPAAFVDEAARAAESARLVAQTLAMIPLSDFMYAMAALPLAVEPIQKIRFIPYAHRRFLRFLAVT